MKGKDKNLKIKGETGKDKPYTLTVNGKDIKTVKEYESRYPGRQLIMQKIFRNCLKTLYFLL